MFSSHCDRDFEIQKPSALLMSVQPIWLLLLYIFDNRVGIAQKSFAIVLWPCGLDLPFQFLTKTIIDPFVLLASGSKWEIANANVISLIQK